MNLGTLALSPFFSWQVTGALVLVCVTFVIYALLIRARGTWLRLAFLTLAIVTLLNPQWVREEREGLSDVALVVVDESQSQSLGERRGQAEAALSEIDAFVAGQRNLELALRRVPPARGGSEGTRLMEPLSQALADIQPERLAGVVVISDGVIHDRAAGAGLGAVGAPVHVLLTGNRNVIDRELVVERVPEFALVDRPVPIELRVQDNGVGAASGRARITVRQDGRTVVEQEVSVGRNVSVWVTPERRGPMLLDVEVTPLEGEVSALNNRAILNVNAVRDRLRVLLISGEPHPGERVWRAALKADPAVDLVHFTILRLPTSRDRTPVNQLSLIPFPTEQLFEEQLQDFDLVVFDRYTLRGVLQLRYLRNLAQYVEEGGAVLVSTGPEFTGPASLFHTPIASVLPTAPTGGLVEQGFTPALSAAGRRHPVTSDLGNGAEEWGRWFRLVPARTRGGDVLMTGPANLPLLVLWRVGEGRVAQLLSDQIWFWARGLEGGGPHGELLRRAAHWLMQEPELEEEALRLTADGDTLTVSRQSMVSEGGVVTVTGPDGTKQTIALSPAGNGLSQATLTVEQVGLYSASDGERMAVAGAGAVNALEFQSLVPTDAHLRLIAEANDGGLFWLADGMPALRRVSASASGAGEGWAGLRRRDAFRTLRLSQVPLLPPALVLALLGVLAALGWWRESR